MDVEQLHSAIFFGLGVLFVVGSQVAIVWARRSESWPVTTGTVTRSEIVQTRTDKGAVIYQAEIEYSYSVHGMEHQSDKVCIGGMLHTSSRRRAEERCRKYPVGAPVRVHYKPSNVTVACLEATAEGSSLILAMGCGALALAVCIHSGLIHFE